MWREKLLGAGGKWCLEQARGQSGTLIASLFEGGKMRGEVETGGVYEECMNTSIDLLLAETKSLTLPLCFV